MALTAPDPLPTPPSRSDTPTDFRIKSDAFVAGMVTFGAQLSAYTLALPNLITGSDFTGTSVSSVLIGTGAKSFTASTGKNWQVGQSIRLASTATPANYMDGYVTTYTPGTGALTVTITAVGGSGTLAAWTISPLPSGSGFASLTGTETLTGKTLTGNIIASFTNGGFTITMPAATTQLVGRNTVDTLTNKTFDIGNNNVTGTTVQFNAALLDGDFATKDGTETHSNKTYTSPVINGGAVRCDSVIVDSVPSSIALNSIGFRGMPIRAPGGAYTFALDDNGWCIANTTGGWTIPSNASKPFPLGAMVSGYNDSGSTQALQITSDTLVWAGVGTTGNRTVAAYGFWSAWKKNATTWIVRGDLS